MLSLTGKQLGEYQIVERIDSRTGSDSTQPSIAQVYRAIRAEGGEAVAVKVFTASRLSPAARTQLRDSLRAVAQLRHPGAPPILGSGVVEAQAYIVMPYLSAGSLADRYARGLAGSLNASELLNELAAVLDAAHQRGIVHGSLKPSSLLFDPESGSIRLVGLGESVLHSTQGAQTGAAGTIYAAPEVTAGQLPTPTADQYSFGVVAAEVLTGLPAEHALGYLRARSVGRAFEHRNLRSPLTAQTLLALSKATAAAPGQRFTSVGEANRSLQIALGKLAPIIKEEPPPVRMVPRRQPRRLRAGIALLLLLFFGVCGIVPAVAAGLIEVPAWAGGGPVATTDRLLFSDPAILLPPEDLLPAGPADAGEEFGGQLPTPTVGYPAQPGSAGGSGVTDLPLPNPTPTPDMASQGPGPTPTSGAPTPTDAPTATAAPTNPPPPTAAPTNPPPPPPVIKKCNGDPTDKKYCTPTPSP